MDANYTEHQIGRALRWIVSILDSHAIPYQIVGGLAARAHGVQRPLVDIDIYLPMEELTPAMGELQPYVIRKPAPHRSDAWEIVYTALVYDGVEIELADSSTDPRFFNRVDQCWERQDINFDASVHVQLYDVETTVMPQEELIRYKRMLDREVDHFDIEQLTGAP